MRRWLRWAAFGWSGLMVLWIVAGLLTVDAQCDESTYVEACEAGAGIGTTIGVMVLVFFWVAGLAVIALLWVVAKPEPASRSVPPPPVLPGRGWSAPDVPHSESHRCDSGKDRGS